VQAQKGTLLDEKCSAQEKLVASLTEQLNAAANTLKELQQKKEQYLQGDSSRKADIKRCDENLLNATKGLEQASADLQSKDAKLGGEVGLLLEGLKNYRSPN
jgi:chromosome segregation ATPase